MQKYDYIITGTGAAGLMLAYQMSKDPFFDSKQILLIDSAAKNQNDRTWCYWEKGDGEWDKITIKKWDKIYFGSQGFSEKIKIKPYQYKMIRSADFYQFILDALDQKTNIKKVQQNVLKCTDEGEVVEVETDQQFYFSDTVFNSIPFEDQYKKQSKYPLLHQHFIGWFIKTDTPVFDAETATFMDFMVAQKGNTRFMYQLPISKKEALVEYTLFSESLLKEEEYEEEIKKYLLKKGITAYQITEKEKGCIPMTSYPFGIHNSKNLLHIGTAGGWTKASTGFTFHSSYKKVQKLISFLKKNKEVSKFDSKTRFWYYDVLFLDVLYHQNEIGASLFSRLFRKNKVKKILKFLDEDTSISEEVRIMSTMPSLKFMKMVWKRIL